MPTWLFFCLDRNFTVSCFRKRVNKVFDTTQVWKRIGNTEKKKSRVFKQRCKSNRVKFSLLKCVIWIERNSHRLFCDQNLWVKNWRSLFWSRKKHPVTRRHISALTWDHFKSKASFQIKRSGQRGWRGKNTPNIGYKAKGLLYASFYFDPNNNKKTILPSLRTKLQRLQLFDLSSLIYNINTISADTLQVFLHFRYKLYDPHLVYRTLSLIWYWSMYRWRSKGGEVYFTPSDFLWPLFIGEQGGVRGCRSPAVSIFYDPLSSNGPHPLEKGFLTLSLDFGFLTDDILKKKRIESLTSEIFFSQKSSNHAILA